MKRNETVETTTESKEACHKCAVLLGAFLDGVLDTAKTLEVDEHLAHCEACRERVELDRAVRGSLKKAMSQVTANDATRARLMAAMVAAQNAEPIPASALEQEKLDHDKNNTEKPEESAQAAQASKAKSTQKRDIARLASWRTLVPLASAAALALLWNGVAQTAPQGGHQTDVMRAGFGHDPLADLVAQHSQQLPPERTDVKDVRAFERYVGVPVHPPQFRAQNARLVGGRMTTVHHERAAMLQYEMGQGAATQRVTVFVYDPRKIQVGRGDELTPRAIGTSEVRVGRSDGYTVAVRGGVDAGIGYTVVSDLDAEHSAQLAVFTDDDQ